MMCVFPYFWEWKQVLKHFPVFIKYMPTFDKQRFKITRQVIGGSTVLDFALRKECDFQTKTSMKTEVRKPGCGVMT